MRLVNQQLILAGLGQKSLFIFISFFLFCFWVKNNKLRLGNWTTRDMKNAIQGLKAPTNCMFSAEQRKGLLSPSLTFQGYVLRM